MKIGIVTILDGYNYGAFLQMYALVTTLREDGHEVDVLDCLSMHKHHPLKVVQAFEAAMKSMPIVRYNRERYDVIIVGSDEVWNVQNGYFEHVPEFFGYHLNCGRLIAYAPSCGFSTYEDFADKAYETAGLSKFSHIYPRDEETRSIVQRLTGKPCPTVVDPTLFLMDRWAQFVDERIQDKRYIVYYSYKKEPIIKYNLLRFARENDCEIHSLLFENDWCDQTVYPTPFQFLTTLRYAQYVVTNTMHGTIFSVMLRKHFLNFSLGQKTLAFREMVGLPTEAVLDENHDYEDFCKTIGREMDDAPVFKKMEVEVKRSRQLLSDAYRQGT